MLLVASSTVIADTTKVTTNIVVENTVIENTVVENTVVESKLVENTVVENKVTPVDATIAQQMAARIELARSVRGEFAQHKTISVLPNPLRSTGTFAFDDETGLVWTTLSPIASELVLSKQGIRQEVQGKTVWQIDANQPAVVTLTQVMTGLLAADWPVLETYFDMSGDFSAAQWQLTLVPRDTAMRTLVNSMRVVGETQIQELTMFETNGDTTQIIFSAIVQLQ